MTKIEDMKRKLLKPSIWKGNVGDEAFAKAAEETARKILYEDSMIKRIEVRDVATYGHEGVIIDDLQRVNFIYGGNGCGKTTLSRVLTSMDRKKDYPNCKVEWTGAPLKVLTYNKDFKDCNLVENIPGVFTLGEASVEAERELEQLRKELNVQKKRLNSKEERIDVRANEIKKDRYRRRETLWKNVYQANQCFQDFLTLYDTKRFFEKRIHELLEEGDYKKAKPKDEVKAMYDRVINRAMPVDLGRIESPVKEYEAVCQVMDDPIWQRIIVASGDVKIAELINRLGLSEWVRQGWLAVKGEAHTEEDDDEAAVCPFCQHKTLTKDFREDIENFFDEAYRNDVEHMKWIVTGYDRASKDLLEKMRQNLEYCEMVNKQPHMGLFRATLQTLEERMAINRSIMAHKISHPNIVADFKNISGPMGTLEELTAEVNRQFDEQRKLSENYQEERSRAYTEVWQYLAKQGAETMRFFDEAIALKESNLAQLKEEADQLRISIKELDDKIKDCERRIASIRPTIERINKRLIKFGFTGFSIQPSRRGNYYQIQREDGSFVKDTLSEGEVTFITFLYYMQLVKGSASKQHIDDPKVLVIDDPVSSLDGNVLKVVGNMVRELTEDVRKKKEGQGGINQVIVLTHNLQFHKDVSYVNGRPFKRNKCNYWRLLKQNNETKVEAYGQMNPIRSGYNQLWQDLKDSRKDSQTLPNIMRGIIEDYFVKYGGYDRNRLLEDHFSDDPAELELMTSMIKWEDDLSHGTEDEVFVEAPQYSNEQYMEVFKRFFEKMGHGAHYEMMMREHQDE